MIPHIPRCQHLQELSGTPPPSKPPTPKPSSTPPARACSVSHMGPCKVMYSERSVTHCRSTVCRCVKLLTFTYNLTPTAPRSGPRARRLTQYCTSATRLASVHKSERKRDRRRSGGARPSRRRYFHQPHSGHTALAADSMSPARAHLLGPLPKGSLLLQHHGVCNELALLRLLHQAIRT